MTDPSYAGRAVVMTYPLIGNCRITPDAAIKASMGGRIYYRELSECQAISLRKGTIQDFLKENDIPGIAGIDTRALTRSFVTREP